MTDLEREAREAAKKLWLGLDPFPIMARSAFVDGYLAAAAPREQELRRLRLLAEEQLTTLRKLKAEMLSDTRDQEIERLRARVKHLEWSIEVAAKMFPLPGEEQIPLPETKASETDGQDSDR